MDINEIRNLLVNYFNSYTTLTQEEEDGIKESMDIRYFKKGDVLLKENDISETCYFIIKGCVRQYSFIDGEEKTTAFYTEKQSVFFQESCTNRKPTGFYLACTEDCIMAVGNEEKEMELYNRFPRFAIIAKQILEQEFSKQQKLLASFMTDSPEQRYLNLLKHQPSLVQRVPQYQIASYIGIKPESLSRIRKRLVSSSFLNH